jgi:hypothetical protein
MKKLRKCLAVCGTVAVLLGSALGTITASAKEYTQVQMQDLQYLWNDFIYESNYGLDIRLDWVKNNDIKFSETPEIPYYFPLFTEYIEETDFDRISLKNFEDWYRTQDLDYFAPKKSISTKPATEVWYATTVYNGQADLDIVYKTTEWEIVSEATGDIIGTLPVYTEDPFPAWMAEQTIIGEKKTEKETEKTDKKAETTSSKKSANITEKPTTTITPKATEKSSFEKEENNSNLLTMVIVCGICIIVGGVGGYFIVRRKK